PLRVHREQAVDPVTLRDAGGDPGILVLLGECGVDDLLGDAGGDDDDAVRVAHDDVPGQHGGAAAGDGHVGVPGHMLATEDGRVGEGGGDAGGAVGVAHEGVPGRRGGAAAGDGHVGVPGRMLATEDGRVGAGGVDGDADGGHRVEVAHAAVGDDAGRAGGMG